MASLQRQEGPRAPELAAALESVRRPLVPWRMPAAPLGVRLKTSPLMHRLLPRRVAVARAEARGRKLWARSASQRDRALAAMEAVVGGTAREGEVAEPARLYVIESEVQKALFWQTWDSVEMDARSAALLDDALSSGRRLVISACHLGPYFYSMSVVKARGYHAYAVAGAWFFDEPSPDYWGRRLARWWNGASHRDDRLVPAAGGFAVLQALLEEGETVRIHFDMPGSRSTPFLGKQVELATGTARLSFSTEALILPMRARRAGHRVWTDVDSPLDPRGFAGPRISRMRSPSATRAGSSSARSPSRIRTGRAVGKRERRRAAGFIRGGAARSAGVLQEGVYRRPWSG